MDLLFHELIVTTNKSVLTVCKPPLGLSGFSFAMLVVCCCGLTLDGSTVNKTNRKLKKFDELVQLMCYNSAKNSRFENNKINI